MQKFLTPQKGILLRKMLPNEALGVRSLIFSVLEEYGLRPEPGATDADLYDVQKNYPDGRFWVLEDSRGNIVGSAALLKIDATTAELRKMYFLPSLRGKGMGSWLMRFVLREAREAGYATICLETASVLKEALQLYRKFGFVNAEGSCHSVRCDIKMKRDLVDSDFDFNTPLISVLRKDSGDENFRYLVDLLDKELTVRDGEEHDFYHQYNKIDTIKNVVVLFREGKVAACGAFKPFTEPDAVEIKRMYVMEESRRNGYAEAVLDELESWARESGYARCVLETGKKQPEAIQLYEKSGYSRIKNFGQYQGIENSLCFQKKL